MFPKYEASCKSSAERNEVIYISLTLYIQLFLFSVELLFIVHHLAEQEPTGVCRMPPAATQVPVKSCALLSEFRICQRFCRLRWLLGMV